MSVCLKRQQCVSLSTNLIHAAKIDIVCVQRSYRMQKRSFIIPHSVQSDRENMENVTGSGFWEYFQTIFFATLWQKRKVRLLSVQLIVAQRKFSYTHKYDSDMEILLNARKMETFKNPICQSFTTVAKSAVNFYFGKTLFWIGHVMWLQRLAYLAKITKITIRTSIEIIYISRHFSKNDSSIHIFLLVQSVKYAFAVYKQIWNRDVL